MWSVVSRSGSYVVTVPLVSNVCIAFGCVVSKEVETFSRASVVIREWLLVVSTLLKWCCNRFLYAVSLLSLICFAYFPGR